MGIPSALSMTTASPSKLSTWILAARPKTLWAGVAPVLMGTALALSDGLLHLPAALAALTFALLIQVATNFCNDYADFKKGADTEDRQGPLRVTQAGLLSPETVLKATWLVFALAVLVGLYLAARAGWPFIVVVFLSVVCGALYTAGPFPLGYLGLGDVSVLVFFGPVAVAGTYLVQASAIPTDVILYGLSPGLLAVAILVVNNLRDIEGDALAGKRTLAVRFGKTFTRTEYGLCIVVATLLPLAIGYRFSEGHGLLLTLLILPLSVSPLRSVFGGATGYHLNPVLGQTARLLLLYSVLFSIGILL